MAEITIPDAILAALANQIADAAAERLAARSAAAERLTDQATGKLALTKAAAADALGMSPDSLRRYVLPEIRIVRVGSLRLIPLVELEAWIERHAARAFERDR